MLKIRARAGFKYLPGTNGEREVILAPGTRYMIVEAKQGSSSHDQIELTVELLPDA